MFKVILNGCKVGLCTARKDG